MKKYLNLLGSVYGTGVEKGDRTGTGTHSLFGAHMRFDLNDGFPLLTTKKLHFKSIAHELLWMISGSTNVRDLQKHGVTIWNEWARADGSLGPVYGKQWREWEGPAQFRRGADFATNEPLEDEGEFGPGIVVDQLKIIVKRIQTYPDCRRLVISAWNPAELSDMALAPCHCLFQFNTRLMKPIERWMSIAHPNDLSRFWTLTEEDRERLLNEAGAPTRYLDCQLYQRSADIFLGVPYNIASYALLTHMVARHCGLAVGDFIWTGGDVHLYDNHRHQASVQRARAPRKLPVLRFTPDAPKDLFDIRYEHLMIEGYDPHPAIAAPVAV